jgi:hypothetical protein
MIMKTKFALMMLVLLASVKSITAQTSGEIQGKVFDELGEPIPGVMILFNNGSSTVGCQTDENGKYRMKPLSSGTYDVEARFIGMKKAGARGVKVVPDQISFAPDLTMLDSLSTGVCEFIEFTNLISKDGATLVTITSEQMKHLPSAHGGNIKNIILSQISDIKSDGRGENLYFRGSRAGSTLYFIDGVKMRENVPNIPSCGIANIQVYTGGVPAKYGDCTGGIVIIDTKSYWDN